MKYYLKLLLLFLTISIFSTGRTMGEAPESITTAGLQESVEIIKDKWGVSHIYAKNQQDLFYAQGYAAARDRLFQFEIWRRKALGTLAEIQGEKALAHDRGARLLRFRGDIQKEMAHYHTDGVEIITSFVLGVNAYIQQTESNPDLLPFEFELLGIRPGLWTPEIVVSRHNALTRGMSSEVSLAKTITALGADKAREILPLQREVFLEGFDGIDLSKVNDQIMADYIASRATPAFENPELKYLNDIEVSTLKSPDLDLEILFKDPFQSVNTKGSNNWVVAGSKTKSGKPILANDPHRAIQSPSLRYWVHLNAPGWNVIGGGEPVLPGVSIGHNEYGAWGLTIFPIDQEDIYVYKTNPDQPNQYRYQGSWKDMEVETTDIQVRGEGIVTELLKYSIHGPILFEDTENHLAYGLKAAWLDVGAAPYLASLRMDQAKTWDEFRHACSFSGLPGENMVWADKKGNIGWQAVGLTPIRFGWSGSLPVPGNGDYEWQGYVPVRAMPHLSNPSEGWYGSANNNNIPKGYPNIFSDTYSDPARIFRLNEVFLTARNHTIEDSKALQYDTKSMTAERLVPLITRLALPTGLKSAASRLDQWNFFLDKDSVAASIYDRWERAMLADLKKKLIPSNIIPYFTIRTSNHLFRNGINGKSNHLGQSPNQEGSVNKTKTLSGLYFEVV